MPQPTYLDDCPDCIPIPTRPPYSCFPVVINAIRGKIDDPKCALHCAETIAVWASGFWINSDNPPVGFPGECIDVAGELEKAVAAQSAGGMAAMGAIDWRAILKKLAEILPLIINLL